MQKKTFDESVSLGNLIYKFSLAGGKDKHTKKKASIIDIQNYTQSIKMKQLYTVIINK